MFKYSRRVLAALAAVALTGLVQSAAAETVRFGVAAEPYPPFASKDSSGTWAGFEIDLAKALCEQMKVECVITEIAWDGIIPALNGSKIDVIFASMSITDERKQEIDFSKPYYFTPSAFVGAKGGSTDISPDALSGKVIGVQASTTNASFLAANYGKSEIKYYNTQDDANADLVSGRIDYMLVDSVGITDFMKTVDAENLEVKGMAPADPLFGAGIGAGLRKGDPLKDKINTALDSLMSGGAYDVIQQIYFDFDVKPK